MPMHLRIGKAWTSYVRKLSAPTLILVLSLLGSLARAGTQAINPNTFVSAGASGQFSTYLAPSIASPWVKLAIGPAGAVSFSSTQITAQLQGITLEPPYNYTQNEVAIGSTATDIMDPHAPTISVNIEVEAPTFADI